MQSPRRRRFLFAVIFTASATVLAAVAALFNLLIDPYAVFGSPAIAGVNVIKLHPDVMVADIKRIIGQRFDPSALILGNSRAEIGFDPQSVALRARGWRTFNGAVPGTGMEDQLVTFRTLGANPVSNPVGNAIVGIDFLDFLHAVDEAPVVVESSPARIDPSFRTKLLALFTTTAVADSIATLRIQRQQDPATLRGDGFNPLLDYRALARSDGYAVLFEQRAAETARNLARQPHSLHVGDSGTSPSLDALRALLQLAATRHVSVHLVTYPYHLLLQYQFDDAGLWALLEQWKTEVAEIADAARRQGADVTVWDFACPSDYASEPIPAVGDRQTAMRWYWEGGHFKNALGDAMLDAMLKTPAPAGSPTGAPTGAATSTPMNAPMSTPISSNDFGYELSPTNVAGRNAACRAALVASRAASPALADRASALAKAAGHAR